MATPKTVFSAQAAILGDAVAMTGYLHGAKVGVFTNQPVLSGNSVLADITPATYTGFALQTLVWSVPYLGPDGLVHVTGGSLIFQPSDGVTPNTVYGYYIVDTTGAILIAAAYFANPVVLNNALTAVDVAADLVFSA